MTRYTLSDPVMTAIRLAVASDMSAHDKLEAVVVISLGVGLFHREDSVDPTALALPSRQWLEIAQFLTEVETDPDDRVNLGLSWMNLAPSAFEEEVAGDRPGL